MTDPLFRMLANLPEATPDPVHAARVRSSCHAALSIRRVRRRSGLRATDALLASLAAAYLIETVRQALHAFGVV